MNSTKITSCFVGNPLWPIMNLMNIKRGEGREGGGGGVRDRGEYISTTLCCFYLTICDPQQWDNGECFCTLNLPLCFSFISFTAEHWKSSVERITADSTVRQTKGEVLRWISNYQQARGAERERGLRDNNRQVKGRISRWGWGGGGSQTSPGALPLSTNKRFHFLKLLHSPIREVN